MDRDAKLTDWAPIFSKQAGKLNFARTFETILNNKIVLNQKEIDKFKKLVDGKKEGVWMQSLIGLYSDTNHMDLEQQLIKYGVPSLDLPQLVVSLTPLVFNMFAPSDRVQYDYLLCASNLEQPISMFKSWQSRERFLKDCTALLCQLAVHSRYHKNSWVSMECIEPFKIGNPEVVVEGSPGFYVDFSQEFVVFLLYYFDIVDVELFNGVHFMFFKTELETWDNMPNTTKTWDEMFTNARDKNIVDYKYKFDNLESHSKVELYRCYYNHRLPVTTISSKNPTFFSVTKVLSPTSLSVILTHNVEELNELHVKLNEFYKLEHAAFFMKEEDIQPFTECVVSHHGHYKRAMVANIPSDTDVVVELTDFNWMKTIPKSKLMYLHSMFTRLPFQAFTARLGHIRGLLVDKEIIIGWLKNKLLVETDMQGIQVEVCRVDGVKRIVTVLMKVENDDGKLTYLHEMMADKGLVTIIDSKLCQYHTTGLF